MSEPRSSSEVLSFNVSAVAPVLFLIGVIAFKRGGQTRTRDLGRVAIGVGLMVLSLHILLDTLAPAENAPAVRTLLGAMTGEPLLCLLDGRRTHLGRPLQRYSGSARDVPCLLTLHHAG